MYYHEDARAMQSVRGKVYEKSRQNMTIIFDIPRNDVQDADVTQVYEDLKGMVYDDATRTGRHNFEQPLPGGRLPAGQGAVRNALGGRPRGVRGERVPRQARGRRLGDEGHGNGLEGAGVGEALGRWKQEVEYSVERARADPHAEELMTMISAEGAAGLSVTRLLNLREKLSFSLRDVFHIVIPFSKVFYFDRKRRAFLFVNPYHRVAFQEQMTQRSELSGLFQ